MKDYPLIKFTILFISGIIIQNITDTPTVIYIAVLGFIILVVSILLTLKTNLNKKIITAPLLVTGIILLGMFTAHSNKKMDNNFFDKIYKVKNVKAYGEVFSIELQHRGILRFILSTDSLLVNNRIIDAKNKILCKVYDNNTVIIDSVYNLLEPGFKVTINGTYSKGRDIRNPGEFDYNNYLYLKGISGLFTAYNVNNINITESNPNILKSFIFNIRKGIDKQLFQFHSLQAAALLRGLLLADRSEISYDTKADFINSGVVHVLAVSGLHVGYIVLIFLVLFGRLNLYLKSFLTIVGIFLFMFITGVPASVFRASVMAIVMILAFISGRATYLLNSLSLAALFILLINPAEIFNPGFQLSFTAVLSIALIYPLFKRKIDSFNLKNKSLQIIILFAALSISAQIGTMPFTLYYFSKLSVVAVLANVVVIPLIGFIVGIAIFTLFISSVSTFIASCYAATNNLLSAVLFEFVKLSGGFNYSYFQIKEFSIYDCIIFYLFVLLFYIAYKKFNNITAKTMLALLFILNFILFTSLDNKTLLPQNELSILMIDVGQGDAVLIKFPNGKTALIDAGELSAYFDNGERVIMPLLQNLDINKIDYGFVSHIDADHYGGFISLINAGLIKKIFKPLPDSLSSKDKKFEAYLRKNKVPISYYSKQADSIGNTRIYVLNDNFDIKYSSLSTNDKSGFIKLVFGNTSFLFTGDLGSKAEKYYSDRYNLFLKSNVLKVAHHGSSSGSSSEFLRYVNPDISLISAGIGNKFGHPSQIVIDRLLKINSTIYRTDLQGAVLLRSNGSSIKIIRWK